MGRYGNVMLVAGDTAPSFAVRQGEVVRLYLTNTANTRVFNVALPGARMKLVGGDSGRVEREELVESVVLAPSERVVVDVLFAEPGQTSLEHRTPEHTDTLGDVRRRRGAGDAVARRRVRGSAREPGVGGRTATARGVRRRGARQDGRLRRGDGHGRARGRRRVRLPDASRGRGRGVRPLPQVRHEARRSRGTGGLHVPDASRGRERAARPLPEVRHEARRRLARHRVEHEHEHPTTGTTTARGACA